MDINNELMQSNPFPGLRAYRPDEAHLFFGRLESTARVVTRLIENRFVAVIGASGSGKSSLVLSGVIPALMKEDAKSRKTWSFVVIRPELDPVDNLAAELSALSSTPGFTSVNKTNVLANLNNRTEGLVNIVNKIRKNLRQQVVIFVDQFEEIFRYSSASSRGELGDHATDFIDLIVNAVRQPDQGIYFIITLRSEYVSECSRFHSLTNMLNSGSYLLPQLIPDTLVSVIEEPVKLSGAVIDRSLVKVILSDIPDKPGQLPVLQHLLMRMWNHWSRSGDRSRPITVADYDAVGRMKGAISQHAGLAYNSLSDRHKYVCSRLFRSVTMRTDDGKEVRRPEKVSSIADLTGCPAEEIMQVAGIFRSPEYSFLTPGGTAELTTDSVIDLSHESIIRLWASLRKWMDEESAAQKMYLQLAASAASYQEGRGKLWTPPELMMATKWRNENSPTLAWAERLNPAFERTMLFLQKSESEYSAQEEHSNLLGRKKVKRSRFYAGLLGFIVILSLIALGTVWSLRARAEKERSTAMSQRDREVALNQILSDSLGIISEKAAESEIIAEIASGRAEEAERKASAVAVSARNAEKILTVTEAAIAEERRSKMLSVAKSLAVRSLVFSGQKDLQILLAWQGYLFNKRNEGMSNDPDLYAALYDISKRFGNRYYSDYPTAGFSIKALASAQSGSTFFSADSEGRVLQWRSDKPDRGYNILKTGVDVASMAVSPDNNWLACGTSGAGVLMVPLTENAQEYTLSSDDGKITDICFTNDGTRMYASSDKGNVTLWDLASGNGSTASIAAAAIKMIDLAADNSYLAGLTTDGDVILLNDEGRVVPGLIQDKTQKIESIGFVPWNDRLVIVDDHGNAEVWDLLQMKMVDTYRGDDIAVTHIAFNNREKQLITAADNGEIKIRSLDEKGSLPVTINDNVEAVSGLLVVADGNAFLASTHKSVTERAAHVEYMVSDLCSKVSRSLTENEWLAYIGGDIEYEKSCEGRQYRIRVNEIISGE